MDQAQRFGRVVLHCALVGAVAGLCAIVFDVLVSVLSEGLLGGLAGFNPPSAAGDHGFLHVSVPPFRPWMLALLPVLGGLVGGLIVARFAPDAEGHGTDAAIDAYHNRQGTIAPHIPLVKTIASAVTLGTGGSAGREGPIAQIGAGLGYIVSRILNLTAKERRLLMVAGLAAGVGAVFRAPLAAALFSAEILYREMDMEFEVIVPSVIASIVSYSVFTMVLGEGALFVTPPFRFASPLELLPYTALALVVALGAIAYVRVFYFIHETFRLLRMPFIYKPVLGGLLAGAFAFVLPEALGQGYGIVQGALTGELSWQLLLAVVIAKTLTTSFTVGSGQSGGVFGPAIVIGGALAGVVGLFFEAVLPGISPPSGAFVVVGMAGFFAGAANTPISTIIMVSEITGNYRLLVPSMWVCIIAFMLVRRSTLYTKQLARRTDSPVHLGEMMGEVLERLTVNDAICTASCDPVIVMPASASVLEMREAFATSHHACFPVVNEQQELLGVVDDEALRWAVCNDEVRDVLVAADLVEPAPLLHSDESLHQAMHKMVSTGHDELVVVRRSEPTRVEAMLSRRNLVAAYDHQVKEDRTQREAVEDPWAFLRRRKIPASPGERGGGGSGASGTEPAATP